MARQDDYIRITLRIPAALHVRLLETCERTNRSMNAEIITRLERSLDDQDALVAIEQEDDDEGLEELIDKVIGSIANLAIKRAFKGGASGESIEDVYQDIKANFNMRFNFDDRSLEFGLKPKKSR
jgi:hypothetical protein